MHTGVIERGRSRQTRTTSAHASSATASVAALLLDADLTGASVYESLPPRCGMKFDAGVEHTRSVGATGEVT